MGDSSLQALWAATDRQSIDRMQPRNSRLAAKFDHRHYTSSEDSSESDFDTCSEASFLAVPREFRPNVSPKQSPSVRKKSAKKSSALTGGARRLPIPNPPKPTKSSNDLASPNPNLPKFSEEIPANKSVVSKENTVSEGNRLMQGVDKAEITKNKVKPRQKVAIEVVTPRKDGKYLEKIDKSGVPQVRHKEKTESNSLPAYPLKVPQKKTKGIEFEYINVSEHIQITRTQTIEIDIGNLKSDKKHNTATINTPTYKKQREIKKTQTFHPNKKNQKRHYCPNKKEYSSFKNFSNLSKGDTVKWNSMIGLNKCEQQFSKPTKENAAAAFEKNSNRKVEWTVIQEESVHVSEQRLHSIIDHVLENKLQNITDIKETKDYSNYEHMLPGRREPTKNKSSRIKFDNQTKDIGNNRFHNDYIKEPKGMGNLEENGCSEIYIFKNSLRKQGNEGTHSELYHRKQDSIPDKNESPDNFDHDYEPYEGTEQPKNISKSSPRIKFDKKTEGAGNNWFLNNCIKELRERGNLEENECSAVYIFKNGSNKEGNERTHQNTETHSALYQKKQDSSNKKQTELEENMSEQIRDFTAKTKQSQHINELKYRATWDFTREYSPSEMSTPNNAILKKSNNFENLNSLMYFGKEISDLVIGSHTAASTFFSIYNEWKKMRYELIGQFQQLERTMHETSTKYERYQDLLAVGNGVAVIASNVPHPYVKMAAKIVSVLTSLMSMFVKTSDTKILHMDEPEVTQLLLKDIQKSTELYMHGLQCNMQFEETRKTIEEFHQFTMNSEFMETGIECSNMLTFVKGVKEYTPKHRIFYKKLHRCYKELLGKATSAYSRRFCEPFLIYTSNAVDVIEYLGWQFIEVDNATVEAELKEIQHLIQSNGKSASMKDLSSKIKNCIMILNDELESVRKCVTQIPLFGNEMLSLKLEKEMSY